MLSLISIIALADTPFLGADFDVILTISALSESPFLGPAFNLILKMEGMFDLEIDA